MAFKVQYFLLADQVQDVGNGKLNLLGTFDRLFLANVPARYQGFFAVALLVAGTEDELGEHRIAVRVVRPDGRQAGEGGISMRLVPEPGSWPISSTRVVFGMAGVPFREYGRHRVVLLVDGQEVADHPLMVTRPVSAP